MNDVFGLPKVKDCCERPEAAVERPQLSLPSESTDDPESHLSRRRFDRAALAVILLFWISHWGVMSLARTFRYPEQGWGHVSNRAIVTLVAIALSILIFRGLRRLGDRSFGRRAAITVLFAVGGCIVHTAVNMYLFLPFFTPPSDTLFGWFLAFSVSQVDFIWAYSALSLMLLALTFADDLIAQQQHINSLESQTNLARLNALRYQLNPHFLFNSLNAVAGLISSRRNREAEAMVVSLSDLLRTALAADSPDHIPLDEELELQQLYLEIEKIRFPDRLAVTFSLDPSAKSALVPALITQPLVENAIKHGVSRSSRPVEISISAAAVDGDLRVDIEQSGGDVAGEPARGTGVGLRNTAERLRLEFGESARLMTEAKPDGGFLSRLTMPLVSVH